MIAVGDKGMLARLYIYTYIYTHTHTHLVSIHTRLLLIKESSSLHYLTCSHPFCASLNEGTIVWASDKTGSLKAS